MGQILHGSATTTHAIRAAIQRSKAPLKELAAQHDLNQKTVAKWLKRTFVHDAQFMATSADPRHWPRMRQTELGTALQLPHNTPASTRAACENGGVFYLTPQPHERLVYSGHLSTICPIGHTCK